MPDDLADLLAQIAVHGGLVVPFAVEAMVAGYAGCYASEMAYLRQEIEPFVDPCIPWLLDCIDWTLVRPRFKNLRVLPLNDGAVLVFNLAGTSPA